jgi:phospholipase/carboxylesterase
MWYFARNQPAHYWILAPRGIYPTAPSGYSWRPIENGRRGWPSLDGLAPAAEAVLALVDELSATMGVDTSTLDAIGFSQGGALVNTLALLHPGRIGRAGVLAGFMPDGAEAAIRPGLLSGKPFFVAHGTQDEMVPLEKAHWSIGLLEQAGAHVTFCDAELGHKVSAGCLHGLEEFLGGQAI